MFWELIAVVLGSLVMWFGGSFAMARWGPWRRFTDRFPAAPDADGTQYRFVSMRVRMQAFWGLVKADYGGCLTAICSDEGITISCPWFPFHQPFTIPQTAIQQVEFDKFRFERWMKVRTVTFPVDNWEVSFAGKVAGDQIWETVPQVGSIRA